MTYLHKFIQGIPKAELHLHIEGSFEPELMFVMAERNGVKLKFSSVEDLKAAYQFTQLQDFLDIYHEGTKVLLHEQDFYDLTTAYLDKVYSQNVRHAEIFIDPQTHTDREIPFEVVVNGVYYALKDFEREHDFSSGIIMCFLRHLDESAAFLTLESALKHKDKIIGIGLASSELGHPPSKFERVFAKAKQEGFRIVAHAGEEGPAEYIWEAINLLDVERIDHGNRSMDDPELLNRIIQDQISLTMCPLSNLKLCVIDDMADHPAKKMMDAGVKVTIHSDDPAYFGGYVNENLYALAEGLHLSMEDITQLAMNSINASFAAPARKKELTNKIEQYVTAYK